VDLRQAHSGVATVERRIAAGREVVRAGSFEWDLRPNVVRWSDALAWIYGLEPGTFEGTVEAYLARVHPDDIERTRRIVEAVFAHPHGVTYEHRIVRADGEVRILYSRIDLIADRTGQPLRMIGSCWDVTDRRMPDDSAESVLGLQRAVLDASADGILVVDRLGDIVTFNQGFLEMWRIPPELAVQRCDQALLEFVRDQLEDPPAFLQHVHELYANPDRDSFDHVRFKDGRVFERCSKPQRVGTAIVGRVWTFRDVTVRERVLARQMLLADASRLLGSLDLDAAFVGLAEIVLPTLGDACAIDLAGPNGPHRVASARLAGARPLPPPGLGPATSQIEQDDGRDWMFVPLMDREEASWKQVVAGRLAFGAPPGRRYDDGDRELGEELARRIALDLANARLVAALQQALRTRDDFLSIAAHEIRGPLTSIHLAVEGLLQGEASAAQRDQLLALVAREDRRLAHFVENLVDLSRIRNGHLPLELEDVDLADVVASTVARLAIDLSRSGSALTVRDSAPVRGRWDRFRIEQVVTNLITNAIKFGLGNPIEVEVHAAGGIATLAVVDHGIGVAPTLRERIFEPFERGVSSRNYGGLGLGLYIVRSIVTRLGGTVRVEPVPGGGSRFVVELPQARPG
jgi:PAS domain S-box-containing protein